eukprot:scaffold176831_cov35-Tisochrysis_lutea.AAC.1
MECSPFRNFSRGSTGWNITALSIRMPNFERAFERCIVAEFRRKRLGAASFLRQDLPVKAYADSFGAPAAHPFSASSPMVLVTPRVSALRHGLLFL